jgi:hypothetical protein
MDILGALLFEGFELPDVFGPLEAFTHLARSGKCRIVTVAETAGAVASVQGPQAVADCELASCVERRIELAKIHIAKKQLGLGAETYRAIIRRIASCQPDCPSSRPKRTDRSPSSDCIANAVESSTRLAAEARSLDCARDDRRQAKPVPDSAALLDARQRRALLEEFRCLGWRDQCVHPFSDNWT